MSRIFRGGIVRGHTVMSSDFAILINLGYNCDIYISLLRASPRRMSPCIKTNRQSQLGLTAAISALQCFQHGLHSSSEYPLTTAALRKTFIMIDKYIEIVGSSNPRLNAMAQDAQATILAVLSQKYTKVGVTIVDDMSGLKKLVAKKPDLVILGMKLVILDPSKGY